jgi:hypothetical protein
MIPNKGDKMYTAFGGKLEVVAFHDMTPTGAYVMLKPAKDSDDPITGQADRRFQCSPEMYCRTELEAWQRYYKECVDEIEPAKKAMLEAEARLRFVQDQGNVAAMKIMHLSPGGLPGSERFLLVVGDDYGKDYYGPFDDLEGVKTWIKNNLRGATASLTMHGDRVQVVWDLAAPRESVEVCKVGFKFKPTIVRDGH